MQPDEQVSRGRGDGSELVEGNDGTAPAPPNTLARRPFVVEEIREGG
ncbi:hypothetical protein SBV1_1930039 [Verrucomicrobia bacterium]|nr:hypothetical protein SBV1_1930039 [Verrucomicrobiota bacterium]